jgi:hypothetical protein
VRAALLFLFVFVAVSAASAQNATPAPEPKPTMRDRLKEPDQAGGLHFTEHWAVAFGGIKQGSGIGAGPAFSTKFANGGFMQLKAVISIRNFQLLQARYDTPRFWNDGAIVISRVRWHHAPSVKLYQLGPDSPDRRIDYDERRTEIGSRLQVTIHPHLLATGGFGVERYRTRADDLPQLVEPQPLAPVAPPPGLGAHPFFAHAVASLAFDSRLSPDYTRRGEFFEAVIHSYSDLDGKEDSFGRFEGTAEQYIPTHGDRGVIGLGAQTWLSISDGARSVPFYLTPTLGGGDLLRAYPSYRFRDRHAMLLTAQYRWAVHKYADVAGTYEGGKVAPVVEDLNFDNMAHSIAIGLRVHSKKAGLLRTDVAYGREGVGFRIGFSAGGS